MAQFGGSPVKAGEEEYQLFRDSEYVLTFPFLFPLPMLMPATGSWPRSTSKYGNTRSKPTAPSWESMKMYHHCTIHIQAWGTKPMLELA